MFFICAASPADNSQNFRKKGNICGSLGSNLYEKVRKGAEKKEEKKWKGRGPKPNLSKGSKYHMTPMMVTMSPLSSKT